MHEKNICAHTNICHFVCRLFNEAATRNGEPITWTCDDIYNRYKVSAEDRELDATRFCDWLKEMDAHGLPSFVDLNHYGQLNAAAFTIAGALEWWAVNREFVSIHYDTTFGTNRSGMKLGLVTSVDGDGHTRIRFATLVAHQNTESFEWVFQKLLEVFRVAPKVILTDSDPALATAIEASFAGTKHLLCTWHLSLNLATNLRGVAGKAWLDVRRKFWQVCYYFQVLSVMMLHHHHYMVIPSVISQICKETDFFSRTKFDAEFKELIDSLPKPPEDNQSKHEEYQKSVKWLQKLYDKREQWAARWTWEYHTAGMILQMKNYINVIV